MRKHEELRKKRDKVPEGFTPKQWRGKSDLDKMREKYRERNPGESKSRIADTTYSRKSNSIESGEISDDVQEVHPAIEVRF